MSTDKDTNYKAPGDPKDDHESERDVEHRRVASATTGRVEHMESAYNNLLKELTRALKNAGIFWNVPPEIPGGTGQQGE